MTGSVLTRRSHLHHFGPNVWAPHFVYRCYDKDGDVIYIGCTFEVERRIAAHRRGGKAASRWLAVCMTRYEVSGPYVGREAGREAEAAAIELEQPVFNVQARRVPLWRSRAEVGQYLVERGHTDLALSTACACWGETRRAGGFDPWCAPHMACAEAWVA